jgi:hypothetical protein
VVLIALVAIIVVVQIYTVWSFATAKVSGEIECSSDYIEYITYNTSSVYAPDVDCAIPVVNGGLFKVCALPRDIHCRGALQNFPIIRAIVEAAR